MAETTEISWTDSTFNPWWGCTKISPGCDHCYAQAFDHRLGGDHWGSRNPRRMLSDDNWQEPFRWNRKAEAQGVRHKVFCGSMCDWADKHAPRELRERLWNVIRQTPYLDWLMLTKRPNNARRYLPDDWHDGYPNVWLGVTVENGKHGLPRVDKVRGIPAAMRFLSIEPLLEDLGTLNLESIDWVIVGGESGPGARPMASEWMDNIRRQCREQGVAFFFKQWGGRDKDKGGCLINGREVKAFPE